MKTVKDDREERLDRLNDDMEKMRERMEVAVCEHLTSAFKVLNRVACLIGRVIYGRAYNDSFKDGGKRQEEHERLQARLDGWTGGTIFRQRELSYFHQDLKHECQWCGSGFWVDNPWFTGEKWGGVILDEAVLCITCMNTLLRIEEEESDVDKFRARMAEYKRKVRR